MSGLISIRDEAPQDAAAIRQVNAEAFGQPQEARLVDALRTNGAVLLSLVAESDTSIVGHICFSPVRLESSDMVLEGAGLAPIAVRPGFQRRGTGSKLILAAIQRLRGMGCPFIVVLGHPEYYPRFGFAPASRHGMRCTWNVPDEVFMVLPLDPARLRGRSGLARYREEFSAVI